MSESVELSTLDLRYEGYRLRDDAREARLLASIAQRGIEEPLEGVDSSTASSAAAPPRSSGSSACPTCPWVRRRPQGS